MESARLLLNLIGVLRHPCDLDLLVFFIKHPNTLIASEQLAAFLGYEIKRISESLDALLDAGLLTRTQHPAHAARLFVLESADPDGGWLPDLMEMASTREGRLLMREELWRRVADGDAPSQARERGAKATPRTGPVLVTPTEPGHGEARAPRTGRR